MGSSDSERIAPVTYLFGTGSQQPSQVRFVELPEEPTPAGQHPSEDGGRAAAEPAAQHVWKDAVEHLEKNGIEPSSKGAAERGKFERINNVSMHALARRGMSAEEMRDLLVRREFTQDEIEEELERLLGVGLLDDTALAETLVRTLRDRKGLGRSALTAELRRRKLDASAIEAAFGDGADDELERAIAIAEKRAPQLRSLDSETAKRRLGAFLMRKGYSGSVVSTAVARALTPSGPVFR